MTLRHLRIFVTVCETGSMTAAAQILYIAQPAISLAVSEMEEHYKVRLFDRISRRLYLTDSGRQALEYARHIIALFDEMEVARRRKNCGSVPALPSAPACFPDISGS